MSKPALDDLFEYRVNYPDFEPQGRLAKLVGLEDQKARLSKFSACWLTPLASPIGRRNSIPVPRICLRRCCAAHLWSS